MLNPIFTAIKQQLNQLAEGAPFLKSIEWFNMQYESTIPNSPCIFVEFTDPLRFEVVSRDERRAKVRIRLHIVSQALAGTDGTIPDSHVAAHEDMALWAKDAIDGMNPENGSCRRITFDTWQHWHKYAGWMVTFIEFESRKSL